MGTGGEERLIVDRRSRGGEVKESNLTSKNFTRLQFGGRLTTRDSNIDR